jgi:hypothetical protein
LHLVLLLCFEPSRHWRCPAQQALSQATTKSWSRRGICRSCDQAETPRPGDSDRLRAGVGTNGLLHARPALPFSRRIRPPWPG